MAATVAAIDRWIVGEAQVYVCVAAAHSVMDTLTDDSLRHVFNSSGLTTPDGMGLVRLLQIKGHRHVERVYGPDLLLQVCAAGLPRGRRHYLYGGDPETLGRLQSVLQARFPGIVIAGAQAPPFRSLSAEEDEQAVRMINLVRPDVVWVGLGSPKQERWMSEHAGRIKAPVMIGVGAAFDFLSGRKPQAPRWMQRSSLEWLFRLATEPRRLWRRYARYPLFIALVAAQALGWRRFPEIDEGHPPA
jgi:N-acetylglucosaminyldiphosphoundecaprenol N-acetyl-beta-D-mannosaminyltransferase